jgi:TfoX/Sxy family transcriptional regulator of competence genes
MPYDEDLANRIREALAGETGVTERKMFGGIAFLVDGNMAVGASSKGGLMVRVDPAETESLLAQPGAGPFEMRGRPLDGWLRVDDDGLRTEDQLDDWVRRGVEYARSLGPKG